MSYHSKYLKYKKKYLSLKNELEGGKQKKKTKSPGAKKPKDKVKNLEKKLKETNAMIEEAKEDIKICFPGKSPGELIKEKMSKKLREPGKELLDSGFEAAFPSLKHIKEQMPYLCKAHPKTLDQFDAIESFTSEFDNGSWKDDRLRDDKYVKEAIKAYKSAGGTKTNYKELIEEVGIKNICSKEELKSRAKQREEYEKKKKGKG